MLLFLFSSTHFFTTLLHHPYSLFFFHFLCFEGNSALWVLFCSLFLSAALLFMIILLGVYHTLILVLLALFTKLHFVSSNSWHCLSCYSPGMTGQSFPSLSAFQHACCSPLLLLMSCCLTLL